MKKVRIVAVLTLLAFLASFSPVFAGLDKLPGIPKNASLVFAVSISGKLKETYDKYFDTVTKSPDFDKMTSSFEQKAGMPFPKELLQLSKTITGINFAVFLNEKNPKNEPCVLFLFNVDNEKSAADMVAKAKEKIAEVVKKEHNVELAFTDSEDNGVKITSIESKDKTKDPFKNAETKILVAGNALGVFVFDKKEAETGKTVLASITKAVKDEKEAIAANDKFKNAAAKVGANASMIFFFDTTPLLNSPDVNDKKMAEAVNYMAFGSDIAGDLSKISTSGIVALNEIKDKEAAKVMDIVKTLLSSTKSDQSPAAVMASDAILFLSLKFNLTKELFANPQLAGGVQMLSMMGGINLEEDLLSWMSGGLFIGINDYTVDINAIKAQNIVAPEIYLGFGCSNPEKASKFFDKVQEIIKNTGNPMVFKDETVAGAKVKVAELPVPQLKGLMLTAGNVGNYFVLSTTKGAFEKAAGAVAKKESSLAETADFKALGFAADASAFINCFMNSEKFYKIGTALAELNPELKKAQMNDASKLFAATASFANNEIKGSMVVTMDPGKFKPEEFLKQINELNKGGSAPKPEDMKAPEPPKMDSPKAEPPKDEAPKEVEGEKTE